MSVYKDQKKGTWYTKFRYKTYDGKVKWITKRGFETKRAALKYERDFLIEQEGSTDMTFSQCVENYRRDREPRIKESTMATKENIIDTKILPYFADKKIRDLTPKDVLNWQNDLLKKTNDKTGKKYSKSYLKTIHNQLSAILNHARKYYGVKENVAQIVGNMGSEKDIEMSFWTKEQYTKFSEMAMENPMMYYVFEVLYWCGLREGEMLALTPADIDFENKTLSITKTYQVIKSKVLITDPKTPKSRRTITMPDFLVDELKDYLSMCYECGESDRLFPTCKSALYRYLKKGHTELGLPKIRVHDLRHSHVSLLINMGFNPVDIADRMGHESIDITYRYAHLFPNVQGDIANKLNNLKEKEEE